MKQLQTLLWEIDGKGYKAYKKIQGSYQFPQYRLRVDHVQGDPFADPSRIRLFVDAKTASFPASCYHSPIRQMALEDFLGRSIARSIRQTIKGSRGSGKSGEIIIATSGQWIIKRNAILVQEDGAVEVRLQLALPAAGRRILSQQAEAMFFQELPAICEQGLLFSQRFSERFAAQLQRHIHSVEDQHYLRLWLDSESLVAFVADGSILPRRTGVDDRPLEEDVTPFVAPDSLAYEVVLPNAGTIRGMGIPTGVTLIVGGGYHGKSTLLHALERGVYNHIPADGRQQVVSLVDAVKIRAEDGRPVTQVNISPFINNLPGGRDTLCFSSANASGSTSQAANIIEALQCGCRLLLIDEDSSASNFMIRDERMQALVSDAKEPITPLVQRIRELYNDHQVSTVLVMGGSGNYFSCADTVIMMDAYVPSDVTAKAHHLAGNDSGSLSQKVRPAFSRTGKPRPSQAMLDPHRYGKMKIESRAVGQLTYGRHDLDLTLVEQLLERGQTRAIGYLILYYAQHGWQHSPILEEGLRLTLQQVEEQGLDRVTPWIMGNLALPRLYELAAAVHRLHREPHWQPGHG